MMNNKYYDNFHLWIPLFAIFISIIGYIIGAYLLSGFGIIFSILYLFYCLGTELLVIIRSCKDCWYYGKICGLGKGKIAPFFVKKGDTKKFVEKDISILHMIPDFLVVIIPIFGGIILLILDFTFLILLLIVILFVIFFGGAAFIRGNFACKYCKQRDIGCPAYVLFNKKKEIQ